MSRTGRVLLSSSGLLLCVGLLLALGVHARGTSPDSAPSKALGIQEAPTGGGIPPAGDEVTLARGEVMLAQGEVTLAELDGTVWSMALEDLDRDGDVDIVSDGLFAWANPHTATSAAPWASVTLAERQGVEDVALGDLDNDGDADVVAGGRYGLAIWQNPLAQGGSTPFGTWPVSQVLTSAQVLINEVAIADLDKDGWLDVAAVRGYSISEGGWLAVWQNPQILTGTWFSSVITSGQGLQALATGDLDRDGWVDLVSGSGLYAPAQEIRAWRNAHAPFTDTWPSSQVIDVFATLGGDDVNSLALADLDDDGWLDVVAGYEDASDMTLGHAGLWRNPHTPFGSTWPVSVTLDAISKVWRVSVGDLDGDGDPDVVGGTAFASTGNEVRWWQNDGSPFEGSWASTWHRYADVMVLDLALADLDRDGGLETIAVLDTVFGAEGQPRIAAYVTLREHAYLPLAIKDVSP